MITAESMRSPEKTICRDGARTESEGPADGSSAGAAPHTDTRMFTSSTSASSSR